MLYNLPSDIYLQAISWELFISHQNILYLFQIYINMPLIHTQNVLKMYMDVTLYVLRSKDKKWNQPCVTAKNCKNCVLTEACRQQDLLEVERLLTINHMDANAPDSQGRYALMEAVKARNVELIKLLLHKSSFKVNVDVLTYNTDHCGYTPLLLAVHMMDTEVAETLIKAGADVNLDKLDVENTPITEAALRNDLDMIKLLLDNGAKVNSLNADGTTALLRIAKEASTDADVEALQFLLGNGGKMSKDDNNDILHVAISCANVPLMEAVLRNGYMFDYSFDREMDLLHTAIRKSETCAITLLEWGYDIERMKYPSEWSYFAQAAWYGHFGLMRLLIDLNPQYLLEDVTIASFVVKTFTICETITCWFIFVFILELLIKDFRS